MKMRFAAPVASAATAVMLLGACSDDGSTTIAKGEGVNFVDSAPFFSNQTMDITAVEEDGEVTGEARFSPAGLTLALQCADTDTDGLVIVGGVEAVSIDVALAPGGRPCGVGLIEISRWVHSLGPGLRLRLYLVDLPDGMSVQTLAITVVAPEERFDDVIAETAPIIDSIEFHVP